MKHPTLLPASLALTLVAIGAQAGEYQAGEPKTLNGLEIAAVYLQPIVMEPAGMMNPAAETDVHLEADIHALADNPNGLPEGAWVPYLTISYELQKAGSDEVIRGDFMPMVASDGPHYGENVKMQGPGEYELSLTIAPPGDAFGRHVDDETGVAPWFAPFTVDYAFVYAGTGKTGSY